MDRTLEKLKPFREVRLNPPGFSDQARPRVSSCCPQRWGRSTRKSRSVISLFCWVIGGTPIVLNAEMAEEDRLTIYLRGDYRNAAPGIVTLNGVYDFNTAWGTLEAAARIGTFTNQPGLWSYKIEGITREFWGDHRLALRIVKNNYYPSTGSEQDTRIAQRLMGVYHPFGFYDPMKSVTLDLDIGMAEDFMGSKGASILPNGNGNLNLVPLWSLKFNLPSEAQTRRYLVSYSNFDIFDPYPASQPFLQFEVQQKINTVTYYSYIRYRWDYSIERFYSLYLTFGLEMPN